MRIIYWNSHVFSSDLVGVPRDLLLVENRILRLIANGAPVPDSAHQLCHEVEAFLPGVICTVMTVDPAGLLDPLAAPSLPAEFSAAIRGVMKGPDVGSCGTAAYMRQPVFVTDIANDPKWRSEERRVGQECVSRGRLRWSPNP